MKKITYIYTGGRIKKLNSIEYADDFFYGSRQFLDKNYEINIIELKKSNFIINKFEHIISKLFSLPLYVFSLLSFKNYKIIKNSDYIFLISESTGFAALPVLYFVKKVSKVKVFMFVMGLYSKDINYKIFKQQHKKLINKLHNYIDGMYFLGKGELNIAKSIYHSNSKLKYLPFHVDNKFWDYPNIDIAKNKNILFIGNDGNRNFLLVNDIARKLQNFNFIFISSNQEILNNKLENVTVIKGKWGNSSLTDLELKKIYSKARLVILPLINSTQPSGQSVALQAMSVGVPVLISKTDGFWDYENFVHNESIFFVNEGIHNWVNDIESVYENVELLFRVSNTAKQLVNKTYDNNLLFRFLLKEINNNINF